jgi:hypothetical protein
MNVADEVLRFTTTKPIQIDWQKLKVVVICHSLWLVIIFGSDNTVHVVIHAVSTSSHS